MDILTQLREKRSVIIDQIDGLMSDPEFDPADTTLTEARSLVEGLDAKIKALVDHEAAKGAASKIDSIAIRTASARKPDEEAPQGTLGTIFTRDRAVAEYPGRGQSPKVETELRALIKTTDLPSNAVTVPGLTVAHTTPLLDAVGRVTISSGSFEYVVVKGAAPSGAIVPEGTVKPEAVLGWETLSSTLQTIAHYVLVTRQALEDSAQLRGLIDSELIAGVLDKMEAEVASVVTGTTATPVDGDTLAKGIRLAAGQIGAAGGRASHVVLNPSDYADLDLEVMSIASMFPTMGTSPWGLTYVPAGAVAAGSPIVMDSRAVRCYQRSTVQTYITDSGYIGGKDLFTTNTFAILAEVRQRSVMLRSEFVVPVTVTP